MVFRLGRSYDKRNLPSVAVYQFENGSMPAYPWGATCRSVGHFVRLLSAQICETTAEDVSEGLSN
jgi:SMODS-associated and fused to various effectors sensor domain